MKKVLILSLYGDLAATNRHRFKQFEINFLDKNVKIEIQSLLDNKYLSAPPYGLDPD